MKKESVKAEKKENQLICPLCCTFLGFDGKFCSHCNFEKTETKKDKIIWLKRK